jgi:hypothetical protein
MDCPRPRCRDWRLGGKQSPASLLLGSKSVQARKRVVELPATERSSGRYRAHDGGSIGTGAGNGFDW